MSEKPLSKNQRRKLRRQQEEEKRRRQLEEAENANEKQQKMLKEQLDRVKKLQQAKGKIASAAVHKFWDSQPVPKLDEIVCDENGPIEPADFENVQQTPYKLNDQFEWTETDISDANVMNEIYTLLNENYVEDDDNMFRFDYSKEFLRWALQPPGWLPSWHIGVRVKKNQKLVAFITGIPVKINVYGKEVDLVEINFLCIHKKLRSKRLAPILIKEITRRVHLQNIWQAIYTAGIVLPRPVATSRYYHRSLNPLKLIDVKFSFLRKNMTRAGMARLYRLPAQPKTPGFREMRKSDVAQCTTKLKDFLMENTTLHPIMNEQELAYWLLPRDNVIHSYVVENPENPGEITDMISFYNLPSTIIGHPKHSSLKVAYAFYNFHTKTSMTDLMRDALISAKNLDFDVFNALNIGDNESCFNDLKFGVGDGFLQYYLYNWQCPQMSPSRMGMVLL